VSDKTKTVGCIGALIILLMTGAVVGLVELARSVGAQQYFWAFQAVVTIMGLAGVISAIERHPPQTESEGRDG